MQSMYIRIKRKKTTVFLHVEPTDTVLEVKQKLQELVEQVRLVPRSAARRCSSCSWWQSLHLPALLQPPEKQQLLKDDVVLEDAKKLSDLKVENEDTLALTFQQEGGCINP